MRVRQQRVKAWPGAYLLQSTHCISIVGPMKASAGVVWAWAAIVPWAWPRSVLCMPIAPLVAAVRSSRVRHSWRGKWTVALYVPAFPAGAAPSASLLLLANTSVNVQQHTLRKDFVPCVSDVQHLLAFLGLKLHARYGGQQRAISHVNREFRHSCGFFYGAGGGAAQQGDEREREGGVSWVSVNDAAKAGEPGHYVASESWPTAVWLTPDFGTHLLQKPPDSISQHFRKQTNVHASKILANRVHKIQDRQTRAWVSLIWYKLSSGNST